MCGKVYGYILLSEGMPKEDEQRDALQAFGVPAPNVYVDGDGQNEGGEQRPAYHKMIEGLRPDEDTVVITSIRQLGKNYGEILGEWRRITEERRAALVVLDMPHLDTRKSCQLDGAQLGNLITQLLSRIAKVEYAFFRQRQAEGIAKAKARGVKFGRKPLERTESYRIFYEAWKKGDISARGAARFLGIDHHTFLNWAQQGR